MNERLAELERRHRELAPGLATARGVSAAVEAIVCHLCGALRLWMGPRLRRAPAVVALGGFGRRELSPRSDIDLLFLWDKRPGPAGTAFAGYLVRMLWDAGLELGHSVRTLAELRSALARDGDLKTAVLDSRWLCGEERLRDDLAAIRSGIRERDGGALLEAMNLAVVWRLPVVFGGIDLAPVIVFLAIMFLENFVVGSLYEFAAGLR